MIRLLISFTFLVMFTMQVSAQGQAEVFIKEAQDYLAQKNYAQAQLSLQDAINEINNMMGGQVAEALPDEINGLVATDENQSGAMGMMGGGTTITKNYSHPTKKENQAEVQIIANAPMLSAINMYITNPAMMGSEYKSVRVGTRRAILKSEMQDFYPSNGSPIKVRNTEIQIPLSQTLITIDATGFASEADELAFANKLDIDKLRTLLGE